jgi:hypothetical protein
MPRSSAYRVARAVSSALHGLIPAKFRNPARRSRPARGGGAIHELLEVRRLLSVNVTTYHYDNARDGANTDETTLTPSNVNSTDFGKVGILAVDGQIYAQPLVMTGVAVAGQGTHDIVLVATEADDVYAFDAHGNDPSSGYLWHTSLLQTGETTVPATDYGSTDITPQIGITGTPVINAATDTLYVVGSFKESNGTYEQRLYALDITSGAFKLGGPVTIAASVAGTGDGASGGEVSFSAFRENQRPALTLANGEVYVAWASHGDQAPFHGWVLGYNATTLHQDYVYCDNPNGSDDGIWMSGGGIAVDAAGDLYFTTGNGTFDANTGGSDYGMAIEKLSPSLGVLDYFAPYNEAELSARDLDYGCSNVILLSGQTGSDPNQILSAGKWGTLYLNDAATGGLGEFSSTKNDDLSEVAFAANQNTDNLKDTIASWDGYVFVGEDGLPLEAYTVAGGKFGAAASSTTTNSFGNQAVQNGQGTGPTISSNGTADGIVWAMDNSPYSSGSPAVLYAYNADNLSQMLYSSSQAADDRDQAVGSANKFQTAVVANGYVYVAGGSAVTIYGLLKTTATPPTITAAAKATPTTVTATTTALTVTATDPSGDAAPTYTWVASVVPSGAKTPTFSANGTAAAAATTATFYKAGAYTFTVTATDPTTGATVTSSVNVTVSQTLTSAAVAPTTASVADAATQQFAASALDQFGNAMATQPTFAWSVKAGGAGGTVSSAGLYTAPKTGTGTDTLTATSGAASASATVTVTAVATSGTTTEESLAGYYNQVGIVDDGSKVAGAGSIDGFGNGLSGTLLGTSQTWNGVPFAIAPATEAGTTDNIVEATGQAIALTQGTYASLDLLALHVNGSVASLTLTVTYTDGTTQTLTQGFSDWYSSQGYAGEAKAITMAYRDTSSGGKDARTFYLYGYSFTLNPAKTLKSVTLPNDTNLKLIAVTAKATATTATTAQVSLAGSFNQVGIVADGSKVAGAGSIDGFGNGLSGTVLGTSQTWGGSTFAIAPATTAGTTDNIVEGAGQTIALPQGNYGSLDLLALHVNGSVASLTSTVTYTDGTTQTIKQGFSDWYSPQTYAGESEAIAMPYRDTSSGGRDARTFYVYGYSFALNAAKTVKSITLPSDANFKLIAADLLPA